MDAIPARDLMYRAVATRDPWYDGLVFFGVRTTGVFCRSSCPATTPAMGNVEYFRTAEAAVKAGYRACKRCRPRDRTGWVPTDFEALLRPEDGFAPRAVVRLTRLLTPLGVMVAGATDKGIRRLRQRLGAAFESGSLPALELLASELRDYFAGSLRTFSVPLVLPGAPFQQGVWTELRSVPYGETWSYSELAHAVGKPGALRAVGRANGDNRVAIVVPCHRIVGADGSLRGYGGGLWRKRALLELEGWEDAASS